MSSWLVYKYGPKSVQLKMFFMMMTLWSLACCRHVMGITNEPGPGHANGNGNGNNNNNNNNNGNNNLNPSPTANFHPPQIIDFTLADATALHRYPPSYEENFDKNYNFAREQQSTQRHDNNAAASFAFPASNAVSSAGGSNYQSSDGGFTTVGPTSPVLSYRDPYTNENYQYTPILTADDDDRNQYTVQTSMFVGGGGGGGGGGAGSNHGGLQFGPGPGSAVAASTRPGLVYDERPPVIRPDRPSYSPPVTGHRPSSVGTIYGSHSGVPPRPPPGPGLGVGVGVGKGGAKPPVIKSSSTFAEQGPKRQYLSYDSHDYPPPSYYQQLQQQQQHQQQQHQQPTVTPFQSPQRQDTASNYLNSPPPSAPGPISSSSSSSLSSNYANNFGNYLQGEDLYASGNFHTPPPQQQQQQEYQQYQQQQQYRPPAPPPPPPPTRFPLQQRPPPSSSFNGNGYYQYQTGEVPPPPGGYRPAGPPPPPPYYRPQGPPLHHQQQQQQQQQPSGLASLASLFTTTQQYAPQFTNLLLGSLTGGGGGGGGGGGAYTRPPNMQLIKALENIARNDDLQCVPRVLCQMIAGQTQRGQLPSFITSPAITNFLAGFPASSPALIYGRAALLGISGGETSCTQTYTKCPKNEYEILHYLNNHRGGFFKFFSEPDEQSAASQNAEDSVSGGGGSGAGGGSLFSILSALTGNSPPATTPRPRPPPTTPRPTIASFDITNGIGNFFNKILSEYVGGIEYQRRRRRRRRRRRSLTNAEIEHEEHDNQRDEDNSTEMKNEPDDEDFHDDEDDEDTHNNDEKHFAKAVTDDENENDERQLDDVEGRILHKTSITALDGQVNFFPKPNAQADGDYGDEEQLKSQIVIEKFNRANAARKFKFPSDNDSDEEKSRLHSSQNAQPVRDTRRGKRVNFVVDASEATKNAGRRGKKIIFRDAEQHAEASAPTVTSIYSGNRIIFPDDYQTGVIRKGRILNRPMYAAAYGDYHSPTSNDRFVVSDSHRQPHAQQDATASYTTSHSQYYTSQTASSSFFANQQSANYVSNRDQQDYFTPTTLRPSANNYAQYHTPAATYSATGPQSSSGAGAAGGYTRYGSNRIVPSAMQAKHEDDKNVYITNGRGVTEYYVTPDGRKIYL